MLAEYRTSPAGAAASTVLTLTGVGSFSAECALQPAAAVAAMRSPIAMHRWVFICLLQWLSQSRLSPSRMRVLPGCTAGLHRRARFAAAEHPTAAPPAAGTCLLKRADSLAPFPVVTRQCEAARGSLEAFDARCSRQSTLRSQLQSAPLSLARSICSFRPARAVSYPNQILPS